MKSELHIKTKGTVINNYTIMNPELCEINNILINIVNNYDKKFVLYKIVCIWKLKFGNDISIDVKSKVMYKISLYRDLVKYLKNKIKYYRRQELEFSHISEMNIFFITGLDLRFHDI